MKECGLRPIVVLITLPSRGLDDLRKTIKELRPALRKLRNRRCFRGKVMAGAGMLEPQLAESGKRWALHAHLTLGLEANASFNEKAAAAAWKRLTGGRGKLLLDPHVDIISEGGFSAYIAKTETWCPETDRLPLPAFGQLRKGLKGRQLLVKWGFPCSG